MCLTGSVSLGRTLLMQDVGVQSGMSTRFWPTRRPSPP